MKEREVKGRRGKGKRKGRMGNRRERKEGKKKKE